MGIMDILNKFINIFSGSIIKDDLPITPRTPKGQKSPKILNKWDESFLNDKINQSKIFQKFKQNELMNNHNSLPITPRTPKGQISPKIYGEWNVMFIDNNFKLTPKKIINTNSEDIKINI
jgi:hypothetical protein